MEESLTFEEDLVAILDRHVKMLRSKEILSVKVYKGVILLRRLLGIELDIWTRYTHLFEPSGTFYPKIFTDENPF